MAKVARTGRLGGTPRAGYPSRQIVRRPTRHTTWPHTMLIGTKKWCRVVCSETRLGRTVPPPPRRKSRKKYQATHVDEATQQNNLILRYLKSLVFTITNPNCNYVKAYKQGTRSNDTCHTLIYLHDSEYTVDNKHRHHFSRHLQAHPIVPTQTPSMGFPGAQLELDDVVELELDA